LIIQPHNPARRDFASASQTPDLSPDSSFRILAVEIVTLQFKKGNRAVLSISDYENPHVSTQVIRVVASYVDYINRIYEKINSN